MNSLISLPLPMVWIIHSCLYFWNPSIFSSFLS
jgi:hypothetical protein